MIRSYWLVTVNDTAIYRITRNKLTLEADLEKLDERFAYGIFDDEDLYHRLRTKKQVEIDQVKEQLLDSDIEISNLDLLMDIIDVFNINYTGQ